MAEILFVVEDVFTVAGRGIILCPGLEKRSIPPLARLVGAPIELRRPDGTSVAATIRGVDLSTDLQSPILLPPGFRKEDVPPGTEVWAVW
jgi:hypothetical protein